MIGLFHENGPFIISDKGSLDANAYSWHRTANMLYVDQPVGTGFSYSSVSSDPAVDKTEDDVKRHFLQFLDAFYTVFPETRSMKLYITGESFAGVYMYS